MTVSSVKEELHSVMRLELLIPAACSLIFPFALYVAFGGSVCGEAPKGSAFYFCAVLARPSDCELGYNNIFVDC